MFACIRYMYLSNVPSHDLSHRPRLNHLNRWCLDSVKAHEDTLRDSISLAFLPC